MLIVQGNMQPNTIQANPKKRHSIIIKFTTVKLIRIIINPGLAEVRFPPADRRLEVWGAEAPRFIEDLLDLESFLQVVRSKHCRRRSVPFRLPPCRQALSRLNPL